MKISYCMALYFYKIPAAFGGPGPAAIAARPVPAPLAEPVGGFGWRVKLTCNLLELNRKDGLPTY